MKDGLCRTFSPQTNRTSDLTREPVTRSNARALRVRIVESEDRGAANTWAYWQAVGRCYRRLWPQPSWAGAVLAYIID
jgi:hypothetical protein